MDLTSTNLDPIQQEAINLCCDMDKRVAAITGAAGTGKTTIIANVYRKLTDHGYNVALCAPTGKAAKRVFEATGIEAKTIHMLLEYSHPGDPDPKTGKPVGYSMPKRTRMNRLDQDVILVDEYAMVNDEVHRSLFDALPSGGVVRMFGDNNQLAPIENNPQLKDQPSPFVKILQDKKNFHSVELTTIFRQAEDSGILMNAQLILKGRIPTRNDQFKLTTTDKPVDVLRDYVTQSAIDGIFFKDIENQILVPQNTSWVGTQKLNIMLQQLHHNELDPCLYVDRHAWTYGEDGVKGGKIRMYKGDKVINTQNQYELGVFNGETGVIIEIDEDTGEIVVDFGDREQSFPPTLMVQNQYGKMSAIDPRKSLDLAYAITTHKSQGSEFKRVVYILNKSNAFMINRRNFYTAITRAREHVHLITDQRMLSHAVYKKD